MFAGLMSRWTRPQRLGLRERVADLAQQVDRPLGRQRPEAPDQRVGIEAVEQLHDVVERAVVGDRRSRTAPPCGASGGGRSTWASRSNRRATSADTPACPAPPVERAPDELDRRGPRQHPVPGPPDLAHPALAEPLLQPVAPQLARAPPRCPARRPPGRPSRRTRPRRPS